MFVIPDVLVDFHHSMPDIVVRPDGHPYYESKAFIVKKWKQHS